MFLVYMDSIKINGHHLAQVARYIYKVRGDSKLEKESLYGYFRGNVDIVIELHEEMIEGRKILVVDCADDLCALCHPDNHWICRDGDGNYQQQEMDVNAARRGGFEIGKTYSLEEILKSYKR
jgi:hypothetical protein